MSHFFFCVLEGIGAGTLGVVVTMRDTGVKTIAIHTPMKVWAFALLLASPLLLVK